MMAFAAPLPIVVGSGDLAPWAATLPLRAKAGVMIRKNALRKLVLIGALPP
jgi:hypothetical protein